MNRQAKRWLALLLTVCVVLTMMPVTAMAENAGIPNIEVSGSTDTSEVPEIPVVPVVSAPILKPESRVTAEDAVAKIGEVFYDTLPAAIAAVQAEQTITLLKDISATAVTNVSNGRAFTLDLNGQTLTSTTRGITVSGANTELTLKDSAKTKGGIVSKSGDGIYVGPQSGKLFATGVTVTGTRRGIAIVGTPATATLTDCTVEATTEYALEITTNNTVTVSGGTYTGKQYGIGTGNSDVVVTEIAGAAVSGGTYGIYNIGIIKSITGTQATGATSGIYNGKTISFIGAGTVLYGSEAITGAGTVINYVEGYEGFVQDTTTPAKWVLAVRKAIEVTVSDVTTFAAEMVKATTQTVVLGADFTIPSTQATMLLKGNITLDLNGHVLTLDGTAERATYWFTVNANASLTIQDSGTNGQIKIISPFKASGGVVNVKSVGNLTMNSGYINATGKMTGGHVILIDNGGTFDMDGGELEAANLAGTTYIVHVNGIFNMSGGYIRGTATNANARALLSNKTFNISGGNIELKVTTAEIGLKTVHMNSGTAALTGGTITAENTGNDIAGTTHALSQSGGTISEISDTIISAKTNTNGVSCGIIQAGGAAVITEIKNSTITAEYTGSLSTHSDYGIYQDHFSAKIGTITGSTIMAKGKVPYGIYVKNSAKSSNLTITGDTTVQAAGVSWRDESVGIYVAVDGVVDKLEQVKVTATDEGEKSINAIVNIGTIKMITPDGTYTAQNGILNTGMVAYPAADKKLVETGAGTGIWQVGTIDVSGLAPVASIGEVKYYDVGAALIHAVDGNTVKLLADISLADGSRASVYNKNITLDLNGHTLSNSKTNALYLSGATLAVTDTSTEKTGKIESITGYGILTEGVVNKLTLTDVEVVGKKRGVQMGVSSDELTITDSTVTGTAEYGLYLATPKTAIVSGSTITGGNRGVHINSSVSSAVMTFTDNVITGTSDTGFYQNTAEQKTKIAVSGGAIIGGNYGVFRQTAAGTGTTISTTMFTNTVITGGLYGVYNNLQLGLTVDGGTALGEVAGIYSGKDFTLAGQVILFGDQAFTVTGTVTYPAGTVGFKQDGTDPETGYKKWILTTESGEVVLPVDAVSVTVGDVTTSYKTFAAAFTAAAKTGGTIKLGRDVIEGFTTTMTIANGKPITIDLNGYTLNGKLNADVHLFTNNGTLTITDSGVAENSADSEGKIRRGAPENAGKIFAANPQNRHKAIVYSAAASSLTVNKVTLEMGGNANAGYGIFNNHAGASITGITDSTIIAPRYPLWTKGQNTGDITNCVIRATGKGLNNNSSEDNNPVCLYLSGTLTAKITAKNITNCELTSTFYGIVAKNSTFGDIKDTDIEAERYHALRLEGCTVNNITNGKFVGCTVDASYYSASVISASGSTIKTITKMNILGGDGIHILSGSNVQYIGDCTITARNTVTTGTYSCGTGINLGDAEVYTGISKDGRMIFMENVTIIAEEQGIDMYTGTISGDLVNCTITSGKDGIANPNNNGIIISGTIDGCTITAKGSRAVDVGYGGSLSKITASKIICDYTPSNLAVRTGTALFLNEAPIGVSVSNTEIISNGNLMYISNNADSTFTNCTFRSTAGDNIEMVTLNGENFHVKNQGTMKLRGGINLDVPEKLASDATIVLLDNVVQSKAVTLSKIMLSTYYKLTLKSEVGQQRTISRNGNYKGELFNVSSGTLELQNITLTGNSDATGPLVNVTSTGTLALSGTPIATGNTVSGSAINLSLGAGKTITLSGALTTGAKVGVTMVSAPAVDAPVQLTTTETSTELYKASKAFFTSDAGHAVLANDTGKYLMLAVMHTVTINGAVQGEKALDSTDYDFSIPDYDSSKFYAVTAIVGGVAVSAVDKGSGNYTIPGASVVGNIVITIAIVESGASITLTFHPNGGNTLPEADTTCSAIVNGTYPPLPVPTRTGHTFAGWNTKADGAGTSIVLGGAVKLAADTTLYAQWTIATYQVTWNYNDGATPSVTASAVYNNAVTIKDSPTFAGHRFDGWLYMGKLYKNIDTFTMPGSDVTFTAQWTKLGTVDVVVGDENGNPVSGATVKIMHGDTEISTKITNAEGKVDFSNLPYGIYNVVATVTNTSGHAITVTKSITIDTAEVKVSVKMPGLRLNTVVTGDVSTAADGLENAISQADKDEITSDTSEGSVTEITITLNAVPSVDSATNAAITAAAIGKTITDFVDITVSKVVKTMDSSGAEVAGTSEPITTTADYLTMYFDISEKLRQELAKAGGTEANILVYRHHLRVDGTATIEQLRKVSAGRGDSANYECYYIVEVQGTPYIAVKAKNFSVYALGSQTAPVTEYNPGGGSATRYDVRVEDTKHGDLTADTARAARGTTVTITAKPDKGYTLKSLTVTGFSDNRVTLTDKGKGKYTFTMPASDVTVSGTFAKQAAVPADPTVTGVADKLNVTDHTAYLSGYPDGSFGPQRNISRAETASLFFGLLKDKTAAEEAGTAATMGTATNTFTDVATDAWYAKAVNTLASLRVISGMGDGSFQPDRPITRAEFASIAAGFAKAADGSSPFTDVSKSHWAYKSISTAQAYGWISGYEDGTFRPEQPITRAEAATIANLMTLRLPDEETIDDGKGNRFSDVKKSHWAFYQIVEAGTTHTFEKTDIAKEEWKKVK